MGHAESQQHPGVHVPFSSAQMQLVLRFPAGSGWSGTRDQSTGYCWKGRAACAAVGKKTSHAAKMHSSKAACCAACCAQHALLAGLLLSLM